MAHATIEFQPDVNGVYLVTGADGYLGRQLCEALLLRGCRVRGLAHHELAHTKRPARMEVVVGDVCDKATVTRLFEGVLPNTAYVFHLAAVISVRRRDDRCMQVNVEGTRNVLDACEAYHARRLIHFASVDALPPQAHGTTVYEPARFSPDHLPTSYGQSKAIAAQMALDCAQRGTLSATVLLPACVIGPGDYRGGFVTKMLSLYLSGIPRVSIGGGYEFVDARDVTLAAMAAVDNGKSGESYILSNRFASVTEVFDILAACSGRKPTLVTLPLWTMVPVAPVVSLIYRILGKQPPLTLDALKLMRAHPRYCHDKAARELNFIPRPMEESLTDAAKFILSVRKAKASRGARSSAHLR